MSNLSSNVFKNSTDIVELYKLQNEYHAQHQTLLEQEFFTPLIERGCITRKRLDVYNLYNAIGARLNELTVEENCLVFPC